MIIFIVIYFFTYIFLYIFVGVNLIVNIMKIISIASQKGGCGKSTVTIMLASHLAYNMKKKVCIIDADTRQKTIVNQRKRNLESVQTSKDEEGNDTVADYDVYKKFFETNIPAYPVFDCQLGEQLFDQLEKLVQEDFDYIFVDLPGSIENNAMFSTLNNCDIIFIPFIQDTVDFQSNFDFARVISEIIAKGNDTRISEIYYFWNKDPQTRSAEKEQMEEYLKMYCPVVKPMTNSIGYSKSTAHDTCRNTIISPCDKYTNFKSFNLGSFLEEATEIICK